MISEFFAFTELKGAFKIQAVLSRRKQMGRLGIVKEFWDFLKVRKKWWLTPIVLVLVLLGALIVFSQGSVVSPFIYPLF